MGLWLCEDPGRQSEVSGRTKRMDHWTLGVSWAHDGSVKGTKARGVGYRCFETLERRAEVGFMFSARGSVRGKC
jgi:hypothetical protein